MDRFAACDQHLPEYLRKLIPDDKVMILRITHLVTAREEYPTTYTCICGIPAHWYAQTVPVADVTGQTARYVE